MKVKLKSKPSVVINSSSGPPQDLPLNPGRPQGELQQESSQGPAPAVSAPLLHPAHGRSVGLELGPLIVGLQGESVQGGASRILVIVNQNSKNLVGIWVASFIVLTISHAVMILSLLPICLFTYKTLTRWNCLINLFESITTEIYCSDRMLFASICSERAIEHYNPEQSWLFLLGK